MVRSRVWIARKSMPGQGHYKCKNPEVGVRLVCPGRARYRGREGEGMEVAGWVAQMEKEALEGSEQRSQD